MRRENLDPTAGARARAIRERPEVPQRIVDATDPRYGQPLTGPVPAPSWGGIDLGNDSQYGGERGTGSRRRLLGHVRSHR
jgi:hypothetical protein